MAESIEELDSPQPWDVARATAKAEVVRLGLTAAQVRAMGYTQVAELCGLTLGKSGESPEWFLYQGERERLAAELEAEVKDAKITELRLAVQAAVDSKLAVNERPVLTDADITALVKGLG